LDIDILYVHLLYMCNRFTGIYQALTGSSWIQLLQMTSDLPVMRSRFSLFLWKFRCDCLFTPCPTWETVECLHSIYCSISHAGGFIFHWEFVLETRLMWMFVYCKARTLVFSPMWPLILQTWVQWLCNSLYRPPVQVLRLDLWS